ncbi:MAG TPA: Ku protein [Candidatus Udaeobacter sp.]|jgi:DNA end-binding protein Ku|nr:Ku protein [Candidatus Udaeobacter sp.]
MAFWKGTLSFGLVEIPVSLRPALDSDDLRFTLLDREGFAPVGNKHYNKSTGDEVPWDRVVRGYEYEPEEYVVLSDEELKSANAHATQTIEIFEFVERDAIEPVYFDVPYFIEALKESSKSYALLRAALERSGRVGVARVVLRTRQRLAAVVVRNSVMMLDLLRYAHELREPQDLVVPGRALKGTGVSERELAMAERLIDDMTGRWEPQKYKDEYRDDVMALIRKKIKSGHTHTIVEAEDGRQAPRRVSEVMDLMPLLKKSLERSQGKGGRAGPARAREPESRRGTRHAKERTRRRSA